MLSSKINSSFLINGKQLYIDQTNNIEQLDANSDLIMMLLRPNGFGKTLFTDLLYYYYDLASKSESDLLFNDTYIGLHPTPNKNKFYVLKFDFSLIDQGLDQQTLQENYTNIIRNSVLSFLTRYPQFSIDFKQNCKSDLNELISHLQNKFKVLSANRILEHLFDEFSYIAKKDQKILVIVDNYNYFNHSFMEQQNFKPIYFMSDFYAKLRHNFQYGLIQRIFIFGETSLSFEHCFSNFFYKNCSYDLMLNQILGFNENQVKQLLLATLDLSKLINLFSHTRTTNQNEAIEQITNDLKEKCGLYSFSKAHNSLLLNPKYCLKYVDRLIQSNYQRLPLCEEIMDVSKAYSQISMVLDQLDQRTRLQLLDQILNMLPMHYVPRQTLLSFDNINEYDHCLLILLELGFLTFMPQKLGEKLEIDSHSFCLFVPNKHIFSLFFQYYQEQRLVS